MLVMYHEADKKVALRAKAKNEMLKEQLRGCSFKPNIGKPLIDNKYAENREKGEYIDEGER
jgi:hypothetical protein